MCNQFKTKLKYKKVLQQHHLSSPKYFQDDTGGAQWTVPKKSAQANSWQCGFFREVHSQVCLTSMLAATFLILPATDLAIMDRIGFAGGSSLKTILPRWQFTARIPMWTGLVTLWTTPCFCNLREKQIKCFNNVFTAHRTDTLHLPSVWSAQTQTLVYGGS